MKKHIYKIKPTKKQLKIIKHYWSMFKSFESNFYKEINELEIRMSNETGIGDLELFNNDGEWVGVGNTSRTMQLIQSDKLRR